MFLVLLFLALLHAVDCPRWQSVTVAVTRGGWTTLPRTLSSCRTHPVPTAVATTAVPAPAAHPWGGTRDPTPEPAGGCLYAHSPRGRPGPRRWPWVPSEGGVRPGQWRGSPRGSGGLAVQQGAQPPRHCGSPSHRVRPAWRPADSPFPPPPPPGRAGAWGEARGRAPPVGGPATTGGTPAPGAEGPLPRHADPGTHCGRVATGGPLSARGGLPAATNQGQRARQGGKSGDGPDRSGALLDTPGADGGGDGGGTSPGDSPPGVAPVSGPPTWLEGVYTPTAHEGAPGRGDGTGSPPGAGSSPGSGTGPHAIVGVGGTAGGAAAAALRLLLAPGVTRTVAGAPPPPAPRPSPPSPRPPSRGAADANGPDGQRRLPA